MGVLLRIFYPIEQAAVVATSDGDGSSRAPWLPQPRAVYIAALGDFLNLPAGVGTWLLRAVHAVQGAWTEETEERLPVAASAVGRLPVAVFSHGLGGFQTCYSITCCELASHGFVVVAPEHSDGSACVAVRPDGETIPCVRSTEALLRDPETGAPDGGFAWRNGQVQVRVDEVLRAVAELLNGSLTTAGDGSSPAAPGDPWKGRLDSENIVMLGHSFGGATVVAACAAAQSAAARGVQGATIFRCGVVLDGWMFPLVGEPCDLTRIDRTFCGRGVGVGVGSGGSAAAGTGATAAAGAAAGAAATVAAAAAEHCTSTPMLFVDAESFLSDARWWAAKQQLVTRAESRGQHGSALLSQRHTVHHSFSDVLVVGGRAFELLSVLRKHRTGLKRGGVADETSGGARADVPPSPEALLSETNRLILDFFLQSQEACQW
eukprot:COSAG01_NODE_9771_length_2349_cov_0.980000_4_plen_433_part_00